jgi:hypothetical protein
MFLIELQSATFLNTLGDLLTSERPISALSLGIVIIIQAANATL